MDINVTLTEAERAVIQEALIEYRDYLDQIKDENRYAVTEDLFVKLKLANEKAGGDRLEKELNRWGIR